MANTRQSIARVTVSEDGKSAVFNFSDGSKRDIATSSFSPEIQARAALQGLISRVRQSYNDADTVGQAIEAYDETVALLSQGTWTQRGSSGPRITILVEALSRLTGRTIAECEDVVNGILDDADEEKSKAQMAALRNDPKVKQAMAQIRLERAAAAAEAPQENQLNLGALFA